MNVFCMMNLLMFGVIRICAQAWCYYVKYVKLGSCAVAARVLFIVMH